MTTTDDVEENLPNPLTPTTSAEDSLTFYDCDQLLNSFPGCSNAVVYKATVLLPTIEACEDCAYESLYKQCEVSNSRTLNTGRGQLYKARNMFF